MDRALCVCGAQHYTKSNVFERVKRDGGLYTMGDTFQSKYDKYNKEHARNNYADEH